MQIRRISLFALFMIAAIPSSVSAQTAVERKCASGKCTCSYIASTCKEWNQSHGGNLAICESYRQTCLSSGRWDDDNRHIDVVVKR